MNLLYQIFTNASKVLGQNNLALEPAAACRKDWYCPFVNRHVGEELLKGGASGCGEGRDLRGLVDLALECWPQPRPGFMRSPKVTGTHPPLFNFPQSDTCFPAYHGDTLSKRLQSQGQPVNVSTPHGADRDFKMVAVLVSVTN